MVALTDRGAPPWHPAPAQVLDRCARRPPLPGSRVQPGEARAAVLGHDQPVRHDRRRQCQSGQRDARRRVDRRADRRRSARRGRGHPRAGPRHRLGQRTAREPGSRAGIVTGQVVDSHLHLIDPDHLDYPWIGAGDKLDTSWDAQAICRRGPPGHGRDRGGGRRGIRAGWRGRCRGCGRRPPAHPWIRGMVAQLPVEQPGKHRRPARPAPRRRPDRRGAPQPPGRAAGIPRSSGPAGRHPPARPGRTAVRRLRAILAAHRAR